MKINSRLVKSLRNQKLWSQEELATACGVSLRTIQRLEGEGQASFDTIKALASVFELEHDYFIQADDSSIDYINVQLGLVLIVIFISISMALTWALSSNNISAAGFVVGVLFCGLIGGAFSTLTTRVTKDKVEWHFALGLLRKSFPLRQVTSVKVVRNKWWWGLGIRLTPDGWLYCVSGLDAIVLRLENGHKVRIGTDEAEEFKLAIERARLKAAIPSN